MSDYKQLFCEDAAPKHLKIDFDDINLTGEDIYSEKFSLEEAVCNQSNIKFGCCIASHVEFRIFNVVKPLKGKLCTISLTPGNDLDDYHLGIYKVDSDRPTADRQYRDIIAYDAMYDITNADVADWYNKILPEKASTVTLKQFRDSFIAYFGLEQEDVELVNDSMTVGKTIEPEELSGQTVITAICEINGCFGHIGRDGKFHYIHLKEMVEGLYPSDTLYPRDDLYPADPMNAERISRSHYISAEYEDFRTERINKLQIRKEENDVGTTYPDNEPKPSDNCYIVQDNFLLYGKSSEELKTVAANMYSIISRIWYRPAHVEARGNPCLEVGDGIRLSTKYDIICTYILQRTLKGIQALRDTYEAEGEQYQTGKVNSVQNSIIQLKGRTNTLTRTVEETNSRITNVEAGLSTRITQNAENIIFEAQRATAAEGTLSSKISLNAENITAEVARAAAAEGNLSSKITQNAQQILLKVSKDSIISEINQTAEQITISASRIDLKGLVNADELVSKFATIATLNAARAELDALIAQRATIESLNAVSATVNNINADYASVGELEVQRVRIDSIESSYISAGTVSAEYATIGSVNSVNSRIDNLLNDRMQVVGYFGLAGDFSFKNTSVRWGTINGNRVLMADD